ncbi:hypothetical protein HDU93_004322 [Gonapodya sp. JEL0774]|nr:hypothetical protein HDU93_004322 [Gonapodya sp. JEL0774]
MPVFDTFPSDHFSETLIVVQIGRDAAHLSILYPFLVSSVPLQSPKADGTNVWSAVACGICQSSSVEKPLFYWKGLSLDAVVESDAASYQILVTDTAKVDKVFEADPAFSPAFGICIPGGISELDPQDDDTSDDDDPNSSLSSIFQSYASSQRLLTETRIARFREEQLLAYHRLLVAARSGKRFLESRLELLQAAAAARRKYGFDSIPSSSAPVPGITRVTSVPSTHIHREPLQPSPRRTSSALSTSLSNPSYLANRPSPKPPAAVTPVSLPPATPIADFASTENASSSDDLDAPKIQSKGKDPETKEPLEVTVIVSPGPGVKARVHFHSEIKDPRTTRIKGKEKERSRSNVPDQNGIFALEGFESEMERPSSTQDEPDAGLEDDSPDEAPSK